MTGQPRHFERASATSAMTSTPEVSLHRTNRRCGAKSDISHCEKTTSLFALALHDRPRFRALAFFGRRPLERVDSLGIPASESLAQKRSLIPGRIGLFPGRRSNRSNCRPQAMKRQGYGGASKSALEFFSKTGPLTLDYDCCSGTEKWSHLRCRRHTDARREWWASISTTPLSLMTVLSTQGCVLSSSDC